MKASTKKLLGIVADEIISGAGDYFSPVFVRFLRATEESLDVLATKDHFVDVHSNKEVFINFNAWLKKRLAEKGLKNINHEVALVSAGKRIWGEFGDK